MATLMDWITFLKIAGKIIKDRYDYVKLEFLGFTTKNVL